MCAAAPHITPPIAAFVTAANTLWQTGGAGYAATQLPTKIAQYKTQIEASAANNFAKWKVLGTPTHLVCSSTDEFALRQLLQSQTLILGAAGTTDITGATCDCQRAGGLQIEVVMGAIVAGAVTTIKAQGSDDDSTYADLAGTAQTVADDADNKVFYVDIVRPLHRYLKLIVARATQNATVGAALAHKYGPIKAPVTQGTNVSGETHYSPAAGTA